MKSLVIAVDLKIIVSLNCLKANKARSMQEGTTSCINYPRYSIDCKFAKFLLCHMFCYVERTNTGALQSFNTKHKKVKLKLLVERF